MKIAKKNQAPHTEFPFGEGEEKGRLRLKKEKEKGVARKASKKPQYANGEGGEEETESENRKQQHLG